MPPAIFFNLDQSEIWLSGNGLIVCSITLYHTIPSFNDPEKERVPRGSVVRCLTRNPGTWVRASLDSLGFFMGVSLGKTLQSLA